MLNDPINGQASLLPSSDVTSVFMNDGTDNPVGIVAIDGATGPDSTQSFDPYGLQNYTGGYNYAASIIPYQFKNGIIDRATGLVKFGQCGYNPSVGNWKLDFSSRGLDCRRVQ